MNQEVYEIRWDKLAWKQLEKIVDYIAEDSLQNANKVRAEIIDKVDSIGKEPTRFAMDKYKENNDGSYRYFELHHQRVAFRVKKNIIK